jgi:putative Mg2+ transporter-C (MgtC) family protein
VSLAVGGPVLSDSEIALRLALAALLSGIVGLERERGERAAGLRTHALVGLGSCLVMVVSAFGFADWHYAQGALDPSRMAAQVISGIGFLGAGVIIFQRDRGMVMGLTTAASVWVVAAVGLAVGGGMYITAVVATAITLLILSGMKPLERHIARGRRSARLSMELEAAVLPVREVVGAVQATGLHVQTVHLRTSSRPKHQVLEVAYSGDAAPEAMADLVEQLKVMPGVHRLTTAVGTAEPRPSGSHAAAWASRRARSAAARSNGAQLPPTPPVE